MSNVICVDRYFVKKGDIVFYIFRLEVLKVYYYSKVFENF